MNLAELCSSVKWKLEFANDEIGYVADEISKQSIEGGAWFLLIAYSKMWKKRGIEEGTVQQKGTKTIWAYPYEIGSKKWESSVLKMNTKGMTRFSVNKEFMAFIWAETLPVWTEENGDGMKWRKAIELN